MDRAHGFSLLPGEAGSLYNPGQQGNPGFSSGTGYVSKAAMLRSSKDTKLRGSGIAIFQNLLTVQWVWHPQLPFPDEESEFLRRPRPNPPCQMCDRGLSSSGLEGPISDAFTDFLWVFDSLRMMSSPAYTGEPYRELPLLKMSGFVSSVYFSGVTEGWVQ